MMPPLTDLHVVSHTHWDREWYHTAERFRARLIELLDDLLDAPPSEAASFLLDGQAVILDDYLAIRPERTAELASLLRQGRLEAGPWYVLADDLIPSGEALVRNLLAGRDAMSRLRNEPPPVLYCPDSFGHPAILPELAKGFGFELVVLWRGHGGGSAPSGDVARWRGPSGADVILYHLPPDGYEFGSSLPVAPSDARSRWESLANLLGPRSTTGISLLLNGADHHARQRDLAQALDQLTTAARPVRIHVSSMRAAAAAIVHSARAASVLPDVSGELRDSYGYTWTLGGTLGTRAGQKRENARIERRLVRDVEPWMALARLARSSTGASEALLREAWRTVLLNHPHDTLCGTSIDAVAAAFDARARSAAEQSRVLRESTLSRLVRHDSDKARNAPSEWTPAVMLRNRAPRPRGGVAEVIIREKIADLAVGPGSALRQGARAELSAPRLNGVALQVLSSCERVELTEAPHSYPDADLIREVRALAWVSPIAGYSIATLAVGERRAGRVQDAVVTKRSTLENARIHIEICADGSVRMHDRVLGRHIMNVLSWERRTDDGDLYTASLGDALPLPMLRRVRRGVRGPLRGELILDYEVGAHARERGILRVSLTLDAGARALSVHLSGVHRGSDQRLRAIFATGCASSRTFADAAFGVVDRSSGEEQRVDHPMEHVIRTSPLHRWVARFGDTGGAVLVSDGLAEYESLSDGSVAVTVIRSVGQLSRPLLPQRPGHAGWPAETPDAQSHGPWDAHFALAMLASDSTAVRGEIADLCDDVLLPLTGEMLRSNLREPFVEGGLELVGDGLAFSAACPARQDGWIVLRCVNQRDAVVQGAWHIGYDVTEAWSARLDETPLVQLGCCDRTIAFTAAPREIVTILAR